MEMYTAVSIRKGARDNADWYYLWKEFGIDLLRFTVFTNKNSKRLEYIHLSVLFPSMSLKHLRPQSRRRNPHYPEYLLALSRTVLLDNLSRNSCIETHHSSVTQAMHGIKTLPF